MALRRTRGGDEHEGNGARGGNARGGKRMENGKESNGELPEKPGTARLTSVRVRTGVQGAVSRGGRSRPGFSFTPIPGYAFPLILAQKCPPRKTRRALSPFSGGTVCDGRGP